MKHSVATVLATIFVLGAAGAQVPAAQDKAVEQAKGPEDRARNPLPGPQALPSPQPSPAVAPTPTPSATPAKPAKWDVNNPPGATIRQVPIAVNEGTWMDIDVSPDGRTIAFTLLGDIYTMPIAGGTPTRIAEGLAWEVHPRFSPDGRRIAFTSDRGGGDNIWVMNADGSDKRQVTKETFRLLNQPSWSRDGRFIVAKKHFTTGRSAGTGEIWMYHVSGGAGVQLVKRVSEQHQKELGEPVYSPDGKAIYYTRNITPGPIFEYAQNSNTDLFNIERYEIATGEVSTAVSGAGGSVRPAPSPDGKSIAFVRRERAKSKLYFKDLTSGVERKIYDALDQDAQETWAVTGVYPNIAWTPDSRSVVFWAGGKIRRVNADGTGAAIIPFRVSDTRGIIAGAPHPRIPVAPATFETRMPRFATVSPDGTRVLFETLGKLWVKPMSGGTPRRLTGGSGDELELFPTWSRDGRTIAFVSWTDAGLGSIRTISAAGGAARDVTSQPGHYARPRFSPDGRTIVFEKGEGGGLTSPDWSENPGVYRVAASGGTPVRILKGMAAPQFGADNDRVFMTAVGGGKRQLISTDLSGGARRTHASGDLASEFIVSPDGNLLAFRQNYAAHVTPLMPGTQEAPADMEAKALPVTRASAGGADYIHWSNDGQRLHWSLGPDVFTADASALFRAAPADEGAAKFVPPTSGVSLSMPVTAARPRGTYALTGARIVTMAADDGGIIDDGVIVVTGDRIAAIGPRASTPIPAGARTIDMAGKTIIPGLVDAHAHGPQGDDEIVPQQSWSAIQNLAMGTTTIHDPSNQASEIFVAAERQQAGMLLAPRIFSTGEIVYGAKNASVYAQIDSLDDALAHVRRLKAQGGHSVKNYNQPRREQRQQVNAASRAEDMLVVAEGGSLFGMDMTIIADGTSTLEHNVPVGVFYEDVLSFFAQGATNYTPTLVVSYGGLAGEPYWDQAIDVWKQPLLRHTPPDRLTAKLVRVTKAPEEDFVDDDNAREAHKLAKRGIKVAIGAHGQQAGIGSHFELWSFVRGGMTPIEALKAGTIVSAQSLGMDRDIGSLEVGKLADLVVLDADPTADIRNSDKIARVMLGGRLYDSMTMNEVDTGTARRMPYWWENGSAAAPAARAGNAAGMGRK